MYHGQCGAGASPHPAPLTPNPLAYTPCVPQTPISALAHAHTHQVYAEAFHTVPKGKCRSYLYCMLIIFYSGWTSYAIYQVGCSVLQCMGGPMEDE